MIKDIAFGIIISLLFISLMVLFCVILIKLYIQKIKKYNQQLFENEINYQKTLNTSILETQKQLLNSVSQDLHDDAGQQLTVINFQLENLKLDFPENEKNLKSISDSVTKLSDSLRQISHSLNPNWLEKNGLINAIKTEVNRIKKNKTITVNLQIEKFEKSFKNEEQIVLFRIFQEIINNSLKHAKSSKIDISLQMNPTFEMKIMDNGIGFNTSTIDENTNSLGLSNLIKRAEIINYQAIIISELNNGTTITIKENSNKL